MSILPQTKRKLSEYVIGVSDMLLSEFGADKVKNKGSMLSTLICNMAKAVQILNDFDDSNCVAKKKELCNTILETVRNNDLNSLRC